MTVTQNRNRITYLKNLTHFMRDIYDADSPGLQFIDNFKKHFHLAL